jgi:hypothetical protein
MKAGEYDRFRLIGFDVRFGSGDLRAVTCGSCRSR